MWIENLFSGKDSDISIETLSNDQKVWLETLKRWEKVVKLKPQDVEARIKLVETNKKLSRHEKAAEILNELISDRADHPLVKILIARRETDIGDPYTAIKYWEEISENDPNNVEPLVQLASIQFKVNNFDEASRLIDSVLKLKPNNLRALMLRAKYHQKIEKYELAIQCWGIVLEKKKNYYEAQQQIVNCYMSLEKYDEAYKRVDIVIAQHPKEIIPKIIKCKILVGMKNWNEALEFVDEQIAQYPGSIEFKIEKSRILYSMDRFDEAEDICSAILDDDSENIAVLTLYARIGQRKVSEHNAA